MAAETASASLGLSYAPEDPTLPKPWTGLIDGSTGLLYYWNPETNLTQYEKPAPVAPPVAAPLPAAAAKLAPIPSARSIPQNGTMSQPLPQQQPQQYPGYQMQQQPMNHQMPNQPSQPMPNQMGHQYPQPQMNQRAQPPAPYMPGPQGHQQQGQPMPSPQGHPQQHGWQSGFPRDGEPRGREESQVALQAPHTQQQQHQQTAASSGDRFPGLAPQIPHAGGYIVRPQQQIGGPSSVSMQHSGAGLNQLPQAYAGQPHQQRPLGGPPLSNQVGNTMVRPVMGQKMGYGEDQHGSAANEYYSSSRKEGPTMFQQQPRHEALPYERNQQGIRMDVANKSVAPGYSGGSNVAAAIAMPSIHGHTGFPTVAPMGSSPRIIRSSDTANISTTDAYRQRHEVTAMGDNVPAPFMTFEATGFPAEILREMHSAGFYSPTPIQAQTWPLALQSRDIVAIAKTGSGKTLGYLIPAFLHLKQCRNNPQIGPTILVLAPTRELATQIQDEAIKFGRSSRISCTCLYGGAPKGPQLKEIERGADIVVATPGRLNDILEMKRINFSQVSFLVLDEADRMLDMGFEPQIRTIVNAIPPRRQTLMYTATWPKEVRKIAGDLLVNPVQVNIGSVDELAANKSITQYVELVPPMEKQRRLEQILRTQEPGSKIIIFCSTKKLCDQLARSLSRTFGAAAIHGDKSQGERDFVLNQFRNGKAPILVATDVAARGLDIKDIRVVVNYDFPTGIEDYVHRIGRTGRAGATGISYTFISDQDWKHVADLVKVLEGANQHVPPEVREMAARGGGSTFSRGRGGMSRIDSGSGRWDSGSGRGMRDGGVGGGRWDSGGRGMRDGSVGGGRWDSGGRGMRDGSQRWDSGGGRGMRDGGNGFGGRGGRSDFIPGGRGNRGRGFGRFDRGPQDRGNSTYGRGRFDGQMGFSERNRDRSYSRSPERVRTYDRSRSRSWSRSRSRSWSRSRSRSWSQSPSRSRSRSRSEDRPERSRARAPSGFDVPPPGHVPAMSLGDGNGTLPKEEPVVQFPHIDDAGVVAGDVPNHQVVDL